jgi:hypothetical protein
LLPQLTALIGLMVVSISTYERPVNFYQKTLRNIPEDKTPQQSLL